MLEEGVLVTLAKNQMIDFWFVLKIEVEWAALMNDVFDMDVIFFVNVRGNSLKNGICIPALSSIFSL
jgi:hypothetical protein